MLDVAQPTYVNRLNLRGSLQPFALKNVCNYEFIFKGDTTSLQDLCNRYLNLPNQGVFHYTAFTPYVWLTFTQIATIAPSRAPYSACGWMGETEVALWVLTAAMHGPVPDHISWFVPYMFVGNPVAISQGREIYGFPKEMGYFNGPWLDTSPQLLSVDAQVVQQFSPNVEMQQGHVLAVARTDQQPPTGTAGGSTTPAEGLATIKALLTPPVPGNAIPSALLDGVIPHSVPSKGGLVLLKQFYDTASSEQACYQALVETPSKITRWGSFSFIDPHYTLTLQTLASHPIAHDLGIADKQAATLAYRTEYDFDMGAGSTIWRAANA